MSHFRSFSIGWENTSGNEVEFSGQQAWQYGNVASLTIGEIGGYSSTLYFGDGTYTTVYSKIIGIDVAESYYVAEIVDAQGNPVTHTYTQPGDYEAYMQSGNRISTNDTFSNSSFRSETIVNVGSGNHQPVSSAPSIIDVADNQIFTYQIPGFDADGDTLTYSIGTADEFIQSSSSSTQLVAPTGVTLSTTGLLTWDVRDAFNGAVAPGQNYVMTAMISDGQTNRALDFIMHIVDASNNTAPEFTNLTVTQYTVGIGQTLNFSLTATDADLDHVNITSNNTPSNMTVTHVHNPGGMGNGQSDIAFTPDATQGGSTYIINFFASDGSLQDNASITITVTANLAPNAFDDDVMFFEEYTATDITSDLLLNDEDPDSDPITIISIDNTGTVGTVTLASGVVTYDPAGQFDHLSAGQQATTTFDYTISDNQPATANSTATATITVTGENDPIVVTSLAQEGTVDETEDALDADPTAATGTITFTDADTNDAHSANVDTSTAIVSESLAHGSLTTAQKDALKDAFSLNVTDIANGNIDWTYDPTNADIDFLGENDSVVLTYTVTIDDNSNPTNDTETETVTITVNGTNDAPVITSVVADHEGTIEETVDVPSGTDADPTPATGTITFIDADDSDTHTANVDTSTAIVSESLANGSLTTAQINALKGAFSLDETNIANGIIDWAYDPSNAVIDFLGENDSVELTYTVTIDDGTTTATTQDVEITVNGMNDAPVITSGGGGMGPGVPVGSKNIGIVPDIIGASPSLDTNFSVNHNTTLLTAGLTGVDLSLYDVIVLPVPNDFLASFAALESFLSGGGTVFLLGENPNWATQNTNINNFLNNIGAGSSINLSSNNLGQFGVDDASFLLSDFSTSAGLTGEAFDLAASSTLIVDPLSNAETVAVFDNTGEAVMSHEQIGNGHLFVAGDTNMSYLDLPNFYNTIANASALLGQGGDNGTGDASNTGDVTELADNHADENIIDHTAEGTITFEDVDLSDTHTISILTPASTHTSVLGGLVDSNYMFDTVTGEGSVDWTYTVADSAIDFLGDGESVTETFTVRIHDGTAYVEETVTITVNGTNDAPVITVDVAASDSDNLALDETDDTITGSGTLSVEDVDVTDIVTVEVESVVINAGSDPLIDSTHPDNMALLDMMSVDMAAVIASGDTTGTINWAFDSDGEAFNYLATDQQLILDYNIRATDDSGTTNSTGDMIVQVTITGTDDLPVVTGVFSGFVTEDITPSISRSIAIDDIDDGENPTFANARGEGDYGVVIVNSTGANWTYTLTNQTLGAGETATDVVTIVADDGTEQEITVYITGTADQPILVDDNFGGLSGEDITGNVFDNDDPAVVNVDLAIVGAGTFATTAGGSVELAEDGSFTYTPAAGFSGTDSFDYTASNTLEEGSATVTLIVEAADTSTDIPEITAILDDDGNPVGTTTDNDLDVSGTAEAGATVQLYANGQPVGDPVVADVNGNWTTATGELPEGALTLTATATDPANNTADSAPSLITIEPVDTSTDVPVISSILDDDGNPVGTTTDNDLDVSGTAEAGATVQLYANGQPVGDPVVADVNGNWTTATGELPEGALTLIATATDPANNTANSTPSLITIEPVDTSTDIPVISSILDDDENPVGTTMDNDLDVSGTAEAGATVQLYANGQPVGDPVVADVNGNWTTATGELPEGALTLTATATDPANNTADSAPSLITIEEDDAPTPDTTDFSAFGFAIHADLNTGEVTTDNLPTVGDPGAIPVVTLDPTDEITATAFHDILIGNANVNFLYGGAGNDIQHGDLGNDKMFGEDGDDMLFGDAGADTIRGGAGNDIIEGGTGSDRILGGDGDDEIDGQVGNDVIDGDAGDDTIFGEAGADTIRAGDGDDTVEGGVGDDTIEGGAGEDNILGHSGEDTIDGGADNDKLWGGNDNDIMDGGDGDDIVNGGAGDDEVNGGAGDDRLWGLDGDDTINGGAGNDIMQGNGGADTFVFDAAGFGADQIHFFVQGEDVMDVSALGITALGDMMLADSALGANHAEITIGGDSIILRGIKDEDITATDFIFA